MSINTDESEDDGHLDAWVPPEEEISEAQNIADRKEAAEKPNQEISASEAQANAAVIRAAMREIIENGRAEDARRTAAAIAFLANDANSTRAEGLKAAFYAGALPLDEISRAVFFFDEFTDSVSKALVETARDAYKTALFADLPAREKRVADAAIRAADIPDDPDNISL